MALSLDLSWTMLDIATIKQLYTWGFFWTGNCELKVYGIKLVIVNGKLNVIFYHVAYIVWLFIRIILCLFQWNMYCIKFLYFLSFHRLFIICIKACKNAFTWNFTRCKACFILTIYFSSIYDIAFWNIKCWRTHILIFH